MPGMGITTQNLQISCPKSMILMPNLSPMGISQSLSYYNQTNSPNAMVPNMPPPGVPMGPGLMSHNSIIGHGSQKPLIATQEGMSFLQGFLPAQSPP
jgi:hypothetical protein